MSKDTLVKLEIKYEVIEDTVTRQTVARKHINGVATSWVAGHWSWSSDGRQGAWTRAYHRCQEMNRKLERFHRVTKTNRSSRLPA